MQRISYLWSLIFSRAPHPVRVLLNLCSLPLLIPVLLYRFLTMSGWGDPRIQSMSFRDLRSQLTLTIRRDDPNEVARAEVTAQATKLIEMRDWVGLDAMLSKLDQTGSKVADGERLYNVVLAAARTHLLNGIKISGPDCGELAMEPVPFQRLELFMDAARSMPENYAINTLAGWLCLQVGWDYRGADYANFVRQEDFEKMETLFAAADTFLNGFDAQDSNSPMLAMVNYERLASISTTLPDLMEAFDVRHRLDPDDWRGLSTHGFYLLPRWYGNDETLEAVAREYYAKTHMKTGAAAYFSIYFNQIIQDAGALFAVDMDLFEQGALDRVSLSKDPQATLNLVLGGIVDASQSAASLESEHPQFEIRRKQLMAMFERLTRERLQEVIFSYWESTSREVHYAIAEAYAEEIKAGDVVHVGNR